jgi:hypothetical protein
VYLGGIADSNVMSSSEWVQRSYPLKISALILKNSEILVNSINWDLHSHELSQGTVAEMTMWRNRQRDKQQSYSKRVTRRGYIKAITRLEDIKIFLA